MPRSRRLRRRPSTPDLHNQIFTADPASPPETPTTSPHLARKISLKPRHQPPFNSFNASLANDPNIKPVGNHQFSYQPTLRPEQLSPRSSSSEENSSDAVDDSADDDSSESASVASLPNAPSAKPYVSAFFRRHMPVQPSLEDSEEEEEEDSEEEESEEDEVDEEEDDEDESEREHGSGEQLPIRQQAQYNMQDDGDSQSEDDTAPRIIVSEATVVVDLILEELDPMDSDWDADEVVQPYEVEQARSRSGSLQHREIVREMKNLNCSAEASDNDADVDLEEEMFLKRQQELRRFRRVSMSSSVGKRSYSELSDSDDDRGPLDVNEVGSSARRMRKRLHRTSILFNDPPEQIKEVEEPESEDEFHNDLARELPYWTMEIMEVDSS